MTKTKLFFFTLLMILTQASCQKNSESQLYILDSIKLGSTMTEFEHHMIKKMQYSKKPGRSFSKLYFVSRQFLYPEEVPDFQTGGYFTLTFNNNDNDDYTDYGLITPTSSSTKDNLIGVQVIFGRTTNSIDLSTALQSITNKIGEPIPYFVQANRAAYIQKIKNLLIEKYGKPTKIVSKEQVPFYAIEGTSLNGYLTDKNNTGDLLEWDNKNVKITFFEGIDNYNFTYDPSENTYFSAIDEDRNKTKKIDKGNEITKGFSYLQYELKEDYIKKNKLNSPNL